MNDNTSPLFNCNVGVRQGENLSPLLFAIFLNDLETTLRKDHVQGLNFVNQLIINNLSDNDVEMWLRLYVPLYADDTIILAESSDDLQRALSSLKSYCSTWDLAVNTSKTKIVIFSRGKVRNRPTFYFGNDTIDVCDDYTYLGVTFNYNGNFKKAINKQVCQARQAMYTLLSKAAKLHLPIDVICDLFDKIVLPILLYGSEIWGFENVTQVKIFYRKFLKKIIKVSKFTPNCVVYWETGRYELVNMINVRMVNFWCRILTDSQNKFSFIIYSLTKKMHDDPTNNFSSK